MCAERISELTLSVWSESITFADDTSVIISDRKFGDFSTLSNW